MRSTIDMAREADLIDDSYAIDWYVYQLKAFEALVRADEREACAKVCDDIDDSHWGCEVKASWCSREIRARGETK
jgi:hypothetical protein